MKNKTFFSFILIFLALATHSISHKCWAQSSPPKEPDLFYVYYDQNFNVIRRLKNELKKIDTPDLELLDQNGLGTVWMSQEKKAPKKIYLIELYEENLKDLSIENADPRVLDRITGPHGGRLIPLLEEEYARYRDKGRFIAESMAYRLLGRNSWYLEPTKEGYGGVFFKRVQDIPLYREKAGRAIHMVNYLEEGLKLLPNDLKSIFITEQVVSKVPFAISSDIFVFRSAEALHEPSAPQNTNHLIFPLHGLLGTNLSFSDRNLKEFAKKSHRNEKQWKQDFFIPQLARITAYLHLVLGVSLENHTQNILVKLDKNSGEILNIYFRDLGDALLNPIVRLIAGEDIEALTKTLSPIGFKNLAYHSWIEPNKSELTEIGYNTAVFTGQSLDSHGRTFLDRVAFNVDFIQSYKETCETISDSTIYLSEEATKILSSLKSAIKIEDIYSSNFNKKGNLDSAVAFIIEDIYQTSLRTLIENKVLSQVSFELNQKEALNIFRKAISENRVSFTGLSSRNFLVPSTQKTWIGEKISRFVTLPRLSVPEWFSKKDSKIRLGYYNSTLWAFDQNQKPLGVIFMDSTKGDLKNFISKIDFNITKANTCISFLK